MKSLVSTALARWADEWGLADLRQSLVVTFSIRMTRSVGRVYRRSGRIVLNSALLQLPRAVFLEVLCHEAAHVAAFRLHGRAAKPHGPEWRKLVQRAGYVPATSLRSAKLEPAPRKVPKPRLRYDCPVCHNRYVVTRASSRLYCRACLAEGTRVSLVRIKPDTNS